MPLTLIERQYSAQAIYMQYLLAQATEKALALKDEVAFDPQGRVLVDVLHPEDERAILEAINQTVKPPFSSLKEALGREPTPITTVSLDVKKIPLLYDKFYQEIANALRQEGLNTTQTADTIKALKTMPKGSIIALQQEFHFHLAMSLRIYQKIAPGRFADKGAELKEAYQETMFEVHALVMEAYAQALKKSIKQPGSVLDTALINQHMDKARKTIAPKAHSLLMTKIIEKTGVVLDPKELKYAADGTSIKHLAEQTTATANDVLHTDEGLNQITLIAGSENTAHHRVSGSEFAHRQMISLVLKDREVSVGKNPRIQIRTPSPVVKEGLDSDKAYSADVAHKLSSVRKHYDLSNRLSGDSLAKPKAFIYNSYTSINHYLGDIRGNLQTQSALHILQGAHQYNAAQLKIKTGHPVFCFVQNNSVNGFGDALGYSSTNQLTIETTLMAELAMLHTLYDVASDEEKKQISELFIRYEHFLRSSPPYDGLFSQSRYGQEARELISQVKASWKNPSPDQEQDEARVALKHLMAYDLHFSKQHAKLIQALSVYVEQASIGGCKSGNERAQSINGRVAILDAVFNRNTLTPEEVQIKSCITRLARGVNVLSNADHLKIALDKAYNNRGLQSAASVISLLDQGGAAKVEAKSNLMNTSTNQAEEQASLMSNLHQSKAASMQAHKKLTSMMLGAWKAETPSWWVRMNSSPLGFAGAVLGLVTVAPALLMVVYSAYDNRLREEQFKSLQQSAQASFNQHSKLMGQIGRYSESEAQTSQEFVAARTTPEVRKALYKGVEQYKSKHKSLIDQYERTTHSPLSGSEDPAYFRKAFLAFIANKETNDAAHYEGDLALRATKPERATISTVSFLGSKGLKLYKLALEEEMNSQEYRNAVFQASTHHYEGEQWATRPVIIVAGPSGSGKSTAADAAVQKAGAEYLDKIPGNTAGNDVLFVDGGVGREVSQMRKLIIQAANNKGYAGISDLHKKSNILNKLKKIMLETALNSSLGVVIPETFSGWLNPVDNIRNLMQHIERVPNTKQLFARVEGDDPSVFAKIVAFMGSRRSWKTKDFQTEPLDLNKKGVPESKAYGAGGYKPGCLGSEAAERWYRENSKEKCCMTIINDLRLYKPDPEHPQEWVPAEKEDQGVILCSLRNYQAWCLLDKAGRVSLQEYNKAHAKPIIKASWDAQKSPQEPRHPAHSEAGTMPYLGDPSSQAPQDDVPGKTMTKAEEALLFNNIDKVSRRVYARSEMPDLSDNRVASDLVGMQSSLLAQGLYDKIPKDKIAVYEVVHNSLSKDNQRIPTAGCFTEEYASEALVEQAGYQGKFVVVHFPKTAGIEGSLPDEAKINFALTMATKALTSMNAPPRADNPLILNGDNEEELRYLWTALMLLNSQHPSMSFGAEAITVRSKGFNPNSELDQSGHWKPNALYNQVVGDARFKKCIEGKLEEFKGVMQLKNAKQNAVAEGEPSSIAFKERRLSMNPVQEECIEAEEQQRLRR